MIQKVLYFAEQHHMIERGDGILAGVSGGGDSVCLLLMLKELSAKYDCSISVVHVEHGIRGAESWQDAEFVQELCKKLEVECLVYHCDAVAFSKEHGMSLEEGARALRYHYFQLAKKRVGANKIAVAHNQNDSAETLLFHLARGTGLRGMCGIAPVRDDIIRPLLCLERQEIEEYLTNNHQEYCTDATNLETEYSRNKIRHQVLPVLQEINSAAVWHLYQSTEIAAQSLALAEELTTEAEGKCVIAGNMGSRLWDAITILEEIQNKPQLIGQMLVLRQLEKIAGSRKDIAAVHATAVLELFQKQVGRKVDLPYDMQALRTYQGVCIEKQQQSDMQPESYVLEPGQELLVESEGWHLKISSRIFEKTEEFPQIPKKTYTKWFDYDKIKGVLLLRKRCSGDYFQVDEQGNRQKLKKYFINQKIPENQRKDIWLLADGSHVIWAIGHRDSQGCRVTKETKRILEIQVNGGNIHE